MKDPTLACGQEFLMGVVARVLMEEPEDLFTLVRLPLESRTRRLGLPDGPGVHPRPRPPIVEHLDEELERWDGLS